ncbi:hypothetical protein AB0F03_02060 [Streptomyces sp. NPDC028722]|uniref:hypothetical protein n=1 Tax=unclassified Streptomyces TaxID=2593676 RepID=UPI0033DD8320
MTADDSTPRSTARPAPDTAGLAASPASVPGHGTEGLRPGTEDLGPETPGTGGTGTDRTLGAPDGSGTGADAPLFPHDEADRWEQRMREVVAGFVDEPKAAVEEADRALEEIAARFTEAVTKRRRTLRTSWEGGEDRGPGAGGDTEQLRLALRDYRELAERLLRG